MADRTQALLQQVLYELSVHHAMLAGILDRLPTPDDATDAQTDAPAETEKPRRAVPRRVKADKGKA